MKTKSIAIENKEFDNLKDKSLILDVRSDIEYKALLKILPSKNIYIYDLIKNPEKFLPDKSQLIITVCNGGNRSSEAAEFLRENGYPNTYVLKDGIYGYQRFLENKIKK